MSRNVPQETDLRQLVVEQIPVSSLKVQQRNPRTHTPKQIRQIAESIRTFGWMNPIIVNADNWIIAGHGRLKAAKLRKLSTVPVLRIEDLSEAQLRAYALADNRLAELAGWDRELLALELQGLLEMDLGFEITTTGFETGEIDVLIGDVNNAADNEADQVPEIDSDTPAVTQTGDLWHLGRHKLLCADAANPESFTPLMGSKLAEMVFTDPPYNVPIDGHVSGRGSLKHAEFAMGSGEMTECEFISFLENVLGSTAAHSRDGAIAFICMDWRHLFELLTAGRRTFSELKNLCVWTKTNGGMGSLYRSQHELVAVFKKGSEPHINNVELGCHGRHRTNVWSYPGMNSFGADRDEALSLHPTVKPVALVQDTILDCSNRNSTVLDPFMGSGTTILAAEQAGRIAYGLELEPRYVDVAILRWQRLTGELVRHGDTGMTFAELAHQRGTALPSPKSWHQPTCDIGGSTDG